MKPTDASVYVVFVKPYEDGSGDEEILGIFRTRLVAESALGRWALKNWDVARPLQILDFQLLPGLHE